MTWKVAGILFALGVCPARGPAETVTVEDLFDFAAPVVDQLDLDETELRAACREIQEHLQGEYVLDLAPLQPMATALVPWLEQHAATEPYAAWLRARLDYFAVVDELRLAIPAPAKPSPWLSVPPVQPSPELERAIWVTNLALRPAHPRAAEFVPRLKPIFEAERVPVELVWLAEVESGFNPGARSPVGAVGLYQLMPATAEWLGLQLRPADQRLSPDHNARAAARYLRYLHDKFGDWRLTLAAYNAGETRVRRLLSRSTARSFDAIAAHLPAETQLYVPKCEATLARREGVKLTELR